MPSSPTLKRTDFGKCSLLSIPICNEVPQKDVMNGPCRVLLAVVDASAVSAEADVYLKFYDDLNPTVGTTDPDHIIRVTKGTVATIPMDLPDGLPFETGLSVAMVKWVSDSNGPGTSGTTPTSSSVPVTLIVAEGVS